MRLSILCLCLLFLVAGCTAPSATEQPGESTPVNILFAIADDASYPHFSAYGCEWIATPNFDRVAKEGLLFTRAYTPNAKCAPSRSCIITGRNSWQLEEAANHWPYFPAHFKSYVEVLNEQGYFTGKTGKGWAPGIALDSSGQQRHLAGPDFSAVKTTPPTPDISNIDYAANFAEFLNARPEDQPFCFWYGGIEPHRAYTYGSGPELTGRAISQIDSVPAYWPDNERVRTDMLDYAAEIEHFDRHLGRMLDTLEAKGLLDNTLIVVTSDNGMPFPRAKSNSYEMANHMPLGIRWPNGIKEPGRTVDAFVSFIDFAPTFLEAAGVKAASANIQPMTGQSLMPILRSEKEKIRDYVLMGKERHDVGRPDDVGYPIRTLLKDSFLLIQNLKSARYPVGPPQTGYLATDGGATKTEVLNSRLETPDAPYWAWCFGKRAATELYDLRTDTDCIFNLAGQTEYATVQQEMSQQLWAALKAEGDPRAFGKGDQFDAYLYSHEKDRDFYNRMIRREPVEAGWVEPTDFEPDFPKRK
ncbi:MAG: sulfatase [Phaeodactylibacter sp.]|uniref:sulfatase family protein n=1 Tax=Phaeodactylibacter sp. TaxID=1940289 RepID=UPI0032EC292D